MELNQKKKCLTQFIISQFLKRAFTKLIILSVSIFSLFFSHSTLLSFLPYFNFYYILTLPLKLFSHTLDKNCTFLLCNGILVFLANYSGSSSSPPPPPPQPPPPSSSNEYNLNDLKSYEDDSQPKMTIMETTRHYHELSIPFHEQEAELKNAQTQLKQNAIEHENGYKESEALEAEDKNSVEENHEEQQQEEEEQEEEEEEDEEEEEEEEVAVLKEANDKAEAGSSFFIEEVDDEETEEEGGNEKLSNEELNKKCDDFIRKMKEKIWIEANSN